MAEPEPEPELVVVAADAAGTAQAVVDCGRTVDAQLNQIAALAATLADPEIWDGAGAERFRARNRSLLSTLHTAGQSMQTTSATALAVIQGVDGADATNQVRTNDSETTGGRLNTSTGQPMVRPGQGMYYKNDTPIDIPPELAEDNRPSDTNWAWKYGHELLGPLAGENRADTVLNAAELYLMARHLDVAAALLEHWLTGDGSAYRIDPAQMMNDVPSFNSDVQQQIEQGLAKGGDFDSGWQSDAVANYPMNTDAEQDWWYALNGYQYRVVGTEVTVNGMPAVRVTTYVFKRYNWGNPTGGSPRQDIVKWGVHWLNQNDAAQLNADGQTHDFNVWGESTRTIMLTNPDTSEA